MPVLGLGTWRMAEDGRRRDDELRALQAGLDLGLTLVDTAEMYGDGAAEELVGEAIRGRRDEVFLVSKVLPSNAGRDAAMRACDASLRRLGTDRIDLYLLHSRGSTPLDETLDAFANLVDQGKVRQWGVSPRERRRPRRRTDRGRRRRPRRCLPAAERSATARDAVTGTN